MDKPRIPWWDSTITGSTLVNEVNDRANKIWRDQMSYSLRDRVLESYFEGRRDMGSGQAAMLASLSPDKSAPARINIIKAKVQGVSSRIAKHRPYPVISADNGTWLERRNAIVASGILRSRMGQTDIEVARLENKSDTMVVGTGVLKVVRTADRDLCVERVPRCEVLIPPAQARRRNPRTLYHVQTMALEVAIALYGKTPEQRDAIMKGAVRPSVDENGFALWGYDWTDSESQQVVVCEAWHLPSGPLDAVKTDGRHVMVVHHASGSGAGGNAAVLFDRPYRRRRLPFSLLHWTPPRRGLLNAVGLVEDLLGLQAKIHSVHRDIQNALYHGSQLRIFLPRMGKINKNHLRKQGDPAVIEYDGIVPQFIAPQAVHPQLFSYLEWLINMCDDVSGLSRDAQVGQTSLGANASGKAQLVFDDMQSERYQLLEMMESFQATDLGTIMLDEAREMADDEEITESQLAPWIREIDWTRFDVDKGLYHLKVEPINFIAGTRAGKLQAIDMLSQAGLISDKLDAIESFEEPDMRRMYRKLLGPRAAVNRLLSDLINPKVKLMDLAPDSFFPIGMGITAVKTELEEAWASRRGPEDEPIMERHRQWLLMADSKQKQIEKNATALPSMPGAGLSLPPGADPLAAAAAPPMGPGMAPGVGVPPGGPMPGPAAPPMAMPG